VTRYTKLAIATVMVVGSALFVATWEAAASAAGTELIGSRCAATGASFPGTILAVRKANGVNESGYVTTASEGGVITSWTIDIGFKTRPIRLAPSIAGKIGDPHKYYIAQQSQPVTVKTGENTFTTRMPISAGQTIALASVGDDPAPYCHGTSSSADVIGLAGKGLTLNEAGPFGPAIANWMIPAEAVLDPYDGGNDYVKFDTHGLAVARRVPSTSGNASGHPYKHQ
jgi:hypothetical protein